MALALDLEIATALAPMAAAMADMVPPPVGDVKARRPMLEAIMAQTGEAQPRPTDVKATDFHVPAPDGAEILVRWFVKEGAGAGLPCCTSTEAE